MPQVKLSLSQSERHHTAHRIPHRVEGHLDQDLEIRDQKFKGELFTPEQVYGTPWSYVGSPVSGDEQSLSQAEQAKQ